MTFRPCVPSCRRGWPNRCALVLPMDDAPDPALSAEQRREALQVALRSSGYRSYVLERDVWVVATLGVVFEAQFGHHLVFQDGRSLSKAWRAIRGFYEDIDLTYDIRGFLPELDAGDDEEVPPHTQPGETLQAGHLPPSCRVVSRRRVPHRR